MLEVADIVRAHAPALRARLGRRLGPGPRQVLAALERCRTPALGGQLWECDGCGRRRYSYHSCRNRHCPKCHGQQTAQWLHRQRARLLPCGYYLLTFTLPAELRPLARAEPKLVYGLLMRCAVAALRKLARDPRYLGGEIAALAVLHTWTRALLFHPHVHLLVPAGGRSQDGRWLAPRHPAFLVPVRALSVIFRAKLRAALRRAHRLDQIPARVWRPQQPWVVHAQPAGRGEQVLAYLARYLFRIALSNSRLERFAEGQVTFRYRDNRTQQLRRVTLPAEQFLERFLWHVLPRGFTKVRYYGWLSPAAHAKFTVLRATLTLPLAAPATAGPPRDEPAAPTTAVAQRCPYCQRGHWRLIQMLPRSRDPP